MPHHRCHSRQLQQNRRVGFTLIELMIVVAIIGILAAIAYPAYQSQIRKGRRIDAKNAVLEMAAREEKFFATNNQYSTTASGLNYSTLPLAIVSGGQAFYKLSVAPTTISSTQDYTISATPISTTDQANDPCDTYKLTNLGEQTNADSSGTAITVAGCW